MSLNVRTRRGAMILIALVLLALGAAASAQEIPTEPDITWMSSDTSVATVDALGNVTPVSPGTVTISAYRGDELLGSVTLTISDECPWCGGNMFDGSSDHTTKWSTYDPEPHYKCVAEHTHHCDSCGQDFLCSRWGGHTICSACRRPWCDKSHGEHTLCPLCKESRQCVGSHGIGKCVKKADCRFDDHYEGDGKGPHKKCDYCGKWRCNGQNHAPRPCKLHCKAELKNQSHDLLDCKKHYACEGGNHQKLPCGHYACQGGNHEKLPCGHYACQSGNHQKLPCGDYACEGGNHEKLPCGHYACQSGNHKSCPFGCGGYLCNGRSHGTARGQCSYVPPETPSGICPWCGTPFSSPPTRPGCDYKQHAK